MYHTLQCPFVSLLRIRLRKACRQRAAALAGLLLASLASRLGWLADPMKEWGAIDFRVWRFVGGGCATIAATLPFGSVSFGRA
jgi:hypothetical protein